MVHVNAHKKEKNQQETYHMSHFYFGQNNWDGGVHANLAHLRQTKSNQEKTHCKY